MISRRTVLALALVLCASVPALWWVHLREAQKGDRMRDVVEGKLELARIELAEARADVAKLDEVVDKLCRAANINGGIQ